MVLGDNLSRRSWAGDLGLVINQQPDAAVEPIDATFRRWDALSQVRGLLRLEDSQERAFGRFQADLGGRVHGSGSSQRLQAHLIIVNNAWSHANTQENAVRS
jgi:hypothetical protein